MTTTELIDLLKKVKQYHGDLDVLVSPPDGYLYEVSSVSAEEVEGFDHIIINAR